LRLRFAEALRARSRTRGRLLADAEEDIMNMIVTTRAVVCPVRHCHRVARETFSELIPGIGTYTATCTGPAGHVSVSSTPHEPAKLVSLPQEAA
jgi:hypothetical protein